MRLRCAAPLTLLVDSSVLAHGITHESAWISGGKKMWGPHEIETGYQTRVPVHADDSDSDLFREIRFLLGIAHLARLGLLQLCTSAELRAEQFRQPAGRFRGYYYDDLNLFSGIEFKGIDGWQLDFGNAAEKQLDRVTDCPDPRFRALVALLGQKHSLDAYHVATAERNGLYAFLHLDLKFSRHVEQHRQHDALNQLQTRILLPSELAALIGLLPMNPRLLSHEESSFFVRGNLHLPEQRRRGPKMRKSRAGAGPRKTAD
jgi:hypothetical protein